MADSTGSPSTSSRPGKLLDQARDAIRLSVAAASSPTIVVSNSMFGYCFFP